MTQLVIICEGATEISFIKNLIIPYLANYNIFVDKKNGVISLGGGINLDKLKAKVNLPANQNKFITTFIDLYGNNDLFDLGKIQNKICPYEKANILAKYLQDKIQHEKFYPHIQPYEVEALLFSDVAKFKIMPSIKDEIIQALKQDVKEFPTPEHINNGKETAPSKRIEHFIKSYNKVLHMQNISQTIGLHKIQQECKHFASWLERLKSLNN